MFEANEHWTVWIARKSHKTHFYDRQYCQSEPMTNTPGLYDASAESRAIIQDTLDNWSVTTEDIPKPDNTIGVGILCDALDYLKGRDIGNRYSHAQEFFGPTLEEWTNQMLDEIEQEQGLVQIDPTPST